ncbi:hypothetical protein MLP_30420 [Microlunatus phosphovorus NM-1]|uniref:HTH cro/C1-type domain-containing protein n=1 Tax=Microlunatus phosphovorus (strain ATCC 700054 / DSM 10555 / JCM 9379 / NBRC 101784 / NCIMB 13414 / VKM Ac-1990 / NM-1) TaxID=1032480 RepID=F5XKI4_MICPN|nr:helix-turn-helix transcriptional regulator [Microlunatus phosphovorus]BAK36056.1 hypothetical protein MLP_30420 [Microlunatus phosphovorus NM-1]
MTRDDRGCAEALAQQLTTEVRVAIKASGMSQRDIADRTGIALRTLSRRLRHIGRTFSVPEIAAIGDILGFTIVDIAERAEQQPAAAVGCQSPAAAAV